eukprot:5614537-Ditylum_brightwellii.AAC.1
MHNSKIIAIDGYLGPFVYLNRKNEQLQVGDIALLIFTENGIGPFWMAEEEHRARRYDKNTGKKSKPKDKTKSELQSEMIKINSQ